MSQIGVISLGCAKNQVDTEHMLAYLKAAGHDFVSDPSEADVLIVNTCGFIEPAKQESINTILEMAEYKKHGRCSVLVATGCLTQRYMDELRNGLPEVDIFLGVHDYAKLPSLLAGALSPVCAPYAGRVLTTPPYSAYLRIGDGCSNRCTYCAIPLIRGPLQSVPMEKLVEEAEILADGGVTELNIIAQDTSGYGLDLYGKPMLLPLLDRLSKISGLHWLRVLYTYPDTVTEELLDAFSSNEKILNYLDIPLQHINDGILKAMNRRGNRAHIESVLNHLVPYRSRFTLRTTMMVGFPGETDGQFQELMEFLRNYPFDRVGAFAFSPEENTPAASMNNQVPEDVKEARLDALMTQQRGISARLNKARIGQTVEVLIEGSDETGLFCRSFAEAPDVDGVIHLPYRSGIKAGQYIKVKLLESDDYDMTGGYLP